MLGCLGNLYDSIENLGDAYIYSKPNINTLLKKTRKVPFWFPNMQALKSNNVYQCSHHQYANCIMCVANDPESTCPVYNCVMNVSLTFVNLGDYVKGVFTYMVFDDLVVTPMSTISAITLLNKFNVKDVGFLEEKAIDMGIGKGVQLLRESMQSKTVLSAVFLGKNMAK
ncbi:hypothetical protein PTKIN_Ptkin16aG0489600 [Pterospermum kingtungense]